jgi:hypothetical protein
VAAVRTCASQAREFATIEQHSINPLIAGRGRAMLFIIVSTWLAEEFPLLLRFLCTGDCRVASQEKAVNLRYS